MWRMDLLARIRAMEQKRAHAATLERRASCQEEDIRRALREGESTGDPQQDFFFQLSGKRRMPELKEYMDVLEHNTKRHQGDLVLTTHNVWDDRSWVLHRRLGIIRGDFSYGINGSDRDYYGLLNIPLQKSVEDSRGTYKSRQDWQQSKEFDLQFDAKKMPGAWRIVGTLGHPNAAKNIYFGKDAVEAYFALGANAAANYLCVMRRKETLSHQELRSLIEGSDKLDLRYVDALKLLGWPVPDFFQRAYKMAYETNALVSAAQ